MQLIGKLIGYVATGVTILIYQQKSRESLLICKTIADLLWICHYVLLGAYTGAAVTTVALVREVVFFRMDLQSRTAKIVLPCFLCISIICSALTWSNMFSLFAMLGSLISIVSFWIGNPKTTRILSFPSSTCTLIYGVANGSEAILVNEILVMLSSATSLFRYRRKKC